MNASTETTDGAPRPRLRIASAVMFVADLDRSVAFYRELVGLEVTSRTEEAVLLVSPDGDQLYLRGIGKRAHHPSGALGIQYLVWTAESEDDLQRCEGVLTAYSAHVTRQSTDGFTVVEGRGPDGVPVVVTYPGPDQAPGSEILHRMYGW